MKKFVLLFLTVSMFAACKDKKTTTEPVTTSTTKKVEATKSTATHDGTPYTIDNSKSKLTWSGTKPGGGHEGTINLKSGVIYSKDGKVTGGDIVIDMKTINCTDQTGDDKVDLEAHLKGEIAGKEDHFFNVASYPTAKFNLSKVVILKNSNTTHMAMGSLTIKGKTAPVGIKCNITESGNTIHIVSKGFSFDRTKWGVNYMSKSIFPNLKDMFVNDKIGLDLDITATK